MTDGEEDGIARSVAEGMYALDRAARAAGVEIVEVATDFARARMTVRDDMCNSHGICHGGYLFLLADTAFAYACNSRNRATVALSGSIHFSASVPPGAVLTAEARAAHRANRTGIYDVVVRVSDGVPVALFRGQSYRVDGESVPGLNARLGRDPVDGT